MRSKRIGKINTSLLLMIFVFVPFWEIFAAQINYFLHIPIQMLSILKYSIILGLIFSLIFEFFLLKSLVTKKYALIVLVYSSYIFLHIIGDVHFMLIFDGLRYEFLYPLMATLILLNKNNILPNFNTIVIIIIIQGITLIIFGLFEVNNQHILEIAYRRPLSEIPHINWYSINRLISLSGNPINLGASTIISMSFLYFYLLENKNIKNNILFIIFLFLSFFIVSATLSRSSLITYAIVVLLIFNMYSKNIYKKSILYFIFFILLAMLFYNLNETLDLGLYIKRFSNLFSVNEYSSNVRVSNWISGFNQLNHIEIFWGKGIGISTPTEELGELYNGIMIENSFVSIFIEFGLIGFLIFSIIYIRYFYLINRMKKYNANISKVLFLFLTTYTLFSFGNDFNRNLPFNLYFWIFYSYLEYYIHLYKGGNNENLISYSNVGYKR